MALLTGLLALAFAALCVITLYRALRQERASAGVARSAVVELDDRADDALAGHDFI